MVVFAFLPFLGLCAVLISQWGRLEPWMQMWLLVFACFYGFKYLTFRQYQKHSGKIIRWPRLFLYLFCWFGMDAKKFLDPEIKLDKAEASFEAWVFICALIGIGLIWGIPRIFRMSEYVQAWFAVAGVFYLLYFTLFQWSSIILRYAGVHAAPFMREPFLLTSLSDFWGKRWNVAFRQLMHDLFFKSFSMSHGPHFAAWLVFFTSGLFHEIIFSLPAQGGWGQPMMYFMIQWAGMRIEKTKWGRRYLKRKFAGKVYAFIFLLVPVKLLFHDPFMYKVIVPFMYAINAW